MVEFLLQNNANINSINDDGMSTALIALGNGHQEVHELLKTFASKHQNH